MTASNKAFARKLTNHEQILDAHENLGRTVPKERIYVELAIKAKEYNCTVQFSTKFLNARGRQFLRSGKFWSQITPRYAFQSACCPIGSLNHRTERASQTWHCKMHVGLGTLEEWIESRRRELQSAQHKQLFDDFAEESTIHTEQIIRLVASVFWPEVSQTIWFLSCAKALRNGGDVARAVAYNLCHRMH